MQPKELLLYYAAIFFIAALLILRRKPRRGMLLRLRGKMKSPKGVRGSQPLASVTPVQKERPLNVFFNYNGHSWDAYEVLGLPAGSSLESAQQAKFEALQKVDAASKPFLEEAFKAIETQWKTYRASS